MSTDILPPARPAYVLRGHTSQIQSLAFSSDNARLLTGDAEGWVVSWTLAYKRPVATWRAHENAVLGLAWWDSETVISHGRDSKLVVWDAKRADEHQLDARLPVDGQVDTQRAPPPILELTLNTMNFCSFAWCIDAAPSLPSESQRQPIVLAVPHTLDSEAIDIFSMPSTDRLSTIPAPKKPPAGMAMALAIESTATATIVAVGYESGHVLVYANSSRLEQPSQTSAGLSRPSVFKEDWKRLYLANPHSQPILSLVLSPDSNYFLTSSADSVLSKHPFHQLLDSYQDVEGTIGQAEEQPLKIMKTKHSGQQGISIRNDGRIFATAGWDGRIRIYSSKNGKEVAVLKWHREGCYSTAFAYVQPSRVSSVPATSAPAGTATESVTSSEIPEENGQLDRSNTQNRSINLSGLTVSEGNGKQSIVAVRRDNKAQITHWLAAGSKDGKISLWDVY